MQISADRLKKIIIEEYIKEERRDRDRDYDDRREREYDERYEDYYRKRYGGGSEPFGRLSLCGRRLVALLHKRKGKNGEYIAPQFCSSEYKNRIQTLDDELGIPELEALYNNQYEYDVSNKDWKKQFTGRDKKMDQEYKKDLTEIPDKIKSDIEIKTVSHVDNVLQIALTKPLKAIDWVDVSVSTAQKEKTTVEKHN